MKITKQNLFLWSIFFIAPFIDALNGFLVFNQILREGSLFSPGQIFRFYIACFGCLFLSKKQLLVVFVTFTLILLIEFFSFNIHQNAKGFMVGIVYAYKLVFIGLIYFVFSNILKSTPILKFIEFFRNSSLLYVLVLFISVAIGIAEPTYGGDAFGTKGLFASGNGLSIFLGVSSLLAYYYYRQTPQNKNLYAFYIILTGTVVIGTKASIIFLLLSIILIFKYSNLKLKSFLVICVFLFVFFYQEKIIEGFITLFDVIVYRYTNSDSIISFFASGRDDYIINAFANFNLDGMRVLRLLFGAGVFVSFREFSAPNLIYDTLETDFFDVFFSFGVIGILIYLIFIFKGYYEVFKKNNLILFFSWLSITTYSLLAGHVLFNAMSSLALILVFVIIENKINIEKI